MTEHHESFTGSARPQQDQSGPSTSSTPSDSRGQKGENDQNAQRDCAETADHLTFRTLLYRYFWFTWLFQDLSKPGNVFVRMAIRRHNIEQSRWLPTYMLRWAVLGSGLFGLGWVIEPLSVIASVFFYVPGVLSMPILAIIGVAWMGLKAMAAQG